MRSAIANIVHECGQGAERLDARVAGRAGVPRPGGRELRGHTPGIQYVLYQIVFCVMLYYIIGALRAGQGGPPDAWKEGPQVPERKQRVDGATRAE